MKTGIYNNLDIDEYHTSPGISSTGISLILDCPLVLTMNTILNEKI